MAEKNFAELKKLTPAERVQRLKEIEEEHKKGIEEVEAMIQESMNEIKEEEDHRMNLPIPQMSAGSEQQLESLEEKQMFKTKRFVSMPAAEEAQAPAPAQRQSLEEMAEEAELKRRREEQAAVSYDTGLGKTVRKSAENIYGVAKELERQKSEYGTLNPQALAKVDTMQQQVERLRGYESDQQTKGLLEFEQGMLERMAASQSYENLKASESRRRMSPGY